MDIVPTMSELEMEVINIRKAALVFRAINNKIRQQALLLLHRNKRITVTALYEKLGLEQSATSAHLAVLKKALLVITQKEGRLVYYSVNYEELHCLDALAKKLAAED